jgi:hypothetical protein
MNDNRRQILDMLGQGKITAEEAERLIAALEREPGTAADKLKYLRVLVDARGCGSPASSPCGRASR